MWLAQQEMSIGHRERERDRKSRVWNETKKAEEDCSELAWGKNLQEVRFFHSRSLLARRLRYIWKIPHAKRREVKRKHLNSLALFFIVVGCEMGAGFHWVNSNSRSYGQTM